MKLLLKRVFVLFVVALLASSPSDAQVFRKLKTRRDIKKAERVEKKEEKKYQKSREKGMKRHYEMQSDETKAQMKASKKRVKHFYKSKKKDPFWIRWKRKRKAKR